MSILLWLESTSFGTFVRESESLLAYPTFSTLHTIGLSIIVGLSTIVALRLMGFAPTLRLAPLRKLFPIMWVGFVINLFSGSGLAAAAATTTLPNPLFIAKIIFVIAAVVILRVLQLKVFRDPVAAEKRLDTSTNALAGLLLSLWLFAMITGRLIAYGLFS
ncbi:MAG: hypothetical protein ACRD88_17020 [Terriglobia bacterium]